MGATQKAMFLASAVVLIGGGIYMSDAQRDVLDVLPNLRTRLSPVRAEGAPAESNPPEASSPPGAGCPAPAQDTVTKAQAVQIGMSQSQVQKLLGPPALVKTEPAANGMTVRVALWMLRADMVGVRFHNGRVTMVTTSRLPQLASPLASNDEKAPGHSGKGRAGQPATPASVQENLRKLEEKLKTSRSPDDILKELFRGTQGK